MLKKKKCFGCNKRTQISTFENSVCCLPLDSNFFKVSLFKEPVFLGIDKKQMLTTG